jgi:hypothetical protein
MTITEPGPGAASVPPEALIPEAREVTRRRRRRRFAATLAVLAILAGGGFVLFGGGGSGPLAVTHPHLPAGIAAQAHDPAGGPAWGIRMVHTAHWTCLQLGRLQGGQLGALGKDGLYRNDGRFHPFPISSHVAAQCSATDGAGHAFMGIELGGEPAAAGPGMGASGCSSGGYGPGPLCPPGDMRFVEYGLLGPDAVSATYTVHGQLHRVATSGPDGAYLVVRSATPAACADLPRYSGCGQTGESTSWLGAPWSGLITSVQYRNGLTCRVTGVRPTTRACLRVGYVPAKPLLPESQVASHVSFRTVPAKNYCWQPSSASQVRSGWPAAARVDLGGYVPCTPALLRRDQGGEIQQGGLLVVFSWTARQPITSHDARYLLYLGGRCGGGGDATYGSIRSGERLTRGMLLNPRCRGTVTGLVAYDPHVSPAPESGQRLGLGPRSQIELPPWAQLVGKFTIRTPRHR